MAHLHVEFLQYIMSVYNVGIQQEQIVAADKIVYLFLYETVCVFSL